MPAFIEVSQLTHRHSDASPETPPALEDVSFSVQAGEMIALVGGNGSGKTTLARHLNALAMPSSGTVLIDGRDTRDRGQHAAIRADVGMVFQHPEDQVVATLVEQDVAFGPENLCRLPAEIRRHVDEALAVVSMSEHRLRQPHMLSAGQIQRVALAGVLAMQPRCIIFDEATAMLDPRGRRDILRQMQDLNQRGITILFITHFMHEVPLASRILLLKRGRLAYDGSPATLFANQALLDECGLEQPAVIRFRVALPQVFRDAPSDLTRLQTMLDAIPPYAGTSQPPATQTRIPSDAAIIDIKGLQHTYLKNTPLAHQSLIDVDLQVPENLPHGIIGATGSGKSTLLQHLNGLYSPQSGSIRVGQFDLNDPGLDVKALRRYIGMVFQNPEQYFFEQYAGDEIAYGLKRLPGQTGIRERVRWAMEWVGLDFDAFKDRLSSTLSGGEQRKVALAAALATRPRLLVLDEPTAGLDPASRRLLLNNLRQLHDQGVQSIFSSHNMEDIVESVENVTVLVDGRDHMQGSVEDIFSDRQALEDAGLEQPPAVRLAQALLTKGWPLSGTALTLSAITAEINALMSPAD